MEIQSNTTTIDMIIPEAETKTPMSVSGDASSQIMVISNDTDLISFDIETAPPVGEIYTGVYNVIPLANASQELQTAHKVLEQNVTIEQIPYYETHNADGITVHIGD